MLLNQKRIISITFLTIALCAVYPPWRHTTNTKDYFLKTGEYFDYEGYRTKTGRIIQYSNSYGFLWDPPSKPWKFDDPKEFSCDWVASIDFSKLFVEMIIVVAIAGSLYYLLPNRK